MSLLPCWALRKRFPMAPLARIPAWDSGDLARVPARWVHSSLLLQDSQNSQVFAKCFGIR